MHLLLRFNSIFTRCNDINYRKATNLNIGPKHEFRAVQNLIVVKKVADVKITVALMKKNFLHRLKICFIIIT